MKTNILLAVDAAPSFGGQHVRGAVEMACQLARPGIDQVVVLHVHEFSVPQLARAMADHGGASGRQVVDDVVAELRSAGVRAGGLIREADFGHVAQTILAVAREFDARLIVLGARGRTDLPRTPCDVATHLLHVSTLPVLIAPSSSVAARPVAGR
jgi:nucleotide-binding universal stress UspA family protein